ncbi:YihY/virulence factor BrkB family protein [Endozoicomonas sp. Mp262]|uniref:YihY/virulence factor BrkB family protein n=1 Tax=Endozoicomonas sp. Mp262 TaxID=2919499 RepID=UPI0021D7EFB7
MKLANPHELAAQLNQWLWETDLTRKHRPQRLLLYTLRIIYAVSRDLTNGQLSLRAMSLVYTTIISLVPLLALSFSVLKGFGVHNQIEPALNNLLGPLGEKRFDVVSNIIGFVDNIKVGVLGAVGLGLLLYSVIAMMQKIEGSFNYTWQIRRGRTFSQRFSDYLSVILIGPLLIFLSIGITATVRSHAVVEYIAALPLMGNLIAFAGFLVPWFLMAFAFAFIYFYIPNTKVNIGSAFIGGLVTAIAWKMMGLIFSTFIASSSNQTAIYSAFASAIVFMVWLYLGWLMLLVGASIAFYHQNPQNQLIRKDEFRLSPAQDERLLLTISYLVAKRFVSGEMGWSARELSRHLNLPADLMEDCFDKLMNIGFLIRTVDKVPRCQPARPLNQLMVNEVASQIHQLCPFGARGLESEGGEESIESYLREREQVLNSRFGDISYDQLVQQVDNK